MDGALHELPIFTLDGAGTLAFQPHNASDNLKTVQTQRTGEQQYSPVKISI
ncbi:hypothetical protein Pan161_11510 [Gimesia algae]|uniref:Uncharacterized protein n=1 Tax=Gimesia algae TaxID=2527971 RepID=A0A517V933_9PLAN|nr:hypothetical protein Pan161_11510 [Gimesia algae]